MLKVFRNEKYDKTRVYIKTAETRYKHNLFFGLSDGNVSGYVQETVKERKTVLPVVSGIIGTLTFLGYGIVCAIRVLHSLKMKELNEERRRLSEAGIILVITCIASAAFPEDILFCNTLSCVLFLGTVAVCSYITRKEKKTEETV